MRIKQSGFDDTYSQVHEETEQINGRVEGVTSGAELNTTSNNDQPLDLGKRVKQEPKWDVKTDSPQWYQSIGYIGKALTKQNFNDLNDLKSAGEKKITIVKLFCEKCCTKFPDQIALKEHICNNSKRKSCSACEINGQSERMTSGSKNSQLLDVEIAVKQEPKWNEPEAPCWEVPVEYVVPNMPPDLEERFEATSAANGIAAQGSVTAEASTALEYAENNQIYSYHNSENFCQLLSQHMLADTSEKRFAFNTDVSVQTGEKPFCCEICDTKFSRSTNLKRHMRVHTGEKPFSCQLCEAKFSRSSHMKTHMNVHTGEKPFSCELCKAKFTQSNNLKKHMLVHTGEKPFSCEICNSRFSRLSHMKTHLSVHTGEKPYSCELCDAKFTQSNNLKKHMLVHTGEKPFSCEICKARFSRSSHIKTHMRVHTGEKPYSCDRCDAKFTQSYNLKKHIRVHTGEKPYKCELCESRFSCSSHMKIHMRVHTGERPFGCKICHSKFTQSTNLKKHMRLHVK